MRKFFVFLFVAFVALTLSSCKDDSIPTDILQGRWVLLANTKGNALVLDFNGDEVEVKNGAWEYRPFTSDYVWDFYLDRDSILHLSRYVGSDDDGSDYEYLDFDLSMSDNNQRMTLYYDPLLGSVRHFTFMKRN